MESSVQFRVFARDHGAAWDALTPAEREIVEALLTGAPIDDIARDRGTRPGTVARQAHNIYAKLGVDGRIRLAARLLDD